MPGGSLIRRPWPGITTKTGFVFLYPQIDWGGSTPGYAETEFPMYPYMVSSGVQAVWLFRQLRSAAVGHFWGHGHLFYVPVGQIGGDQ